MKYPLIAIAFALLGSASTPATAEDPVSPKGPPQTMGDEGKLPATDTLSGAVPEMGATAAPAATGDGSASPKGPPQTMGDQGTLPATGTVSGAVPQMTPSGGSDK